MNLDSSSLKSLAAVCQAALDYRLLALDAEFGPGGAVKKLFCSGNQRQFARLLVSESFGRGQEWGQLDAMAFHHILANSDRASIWRVPFIHKMMAEFKRNSWMVANGTGHFKLLPDRWPNWLVVKEQMKARDHSRLGFIPDDELNAMLAKISQGNAAAMGQSDFIGGETFAGVATLRMIATGESFAPVPPKPPDPPPEPPENPSEYRSFVRPSQSHSTSDLPPGSSLLRKSVIIRSQRQNEKSRSSRDGDGKQRPIMGRGLCVNDGYIAEKLARHPNGVKLRRELTAQITFTARKFQQYFENNPNAAREDLAWFLEANNPNARMNTHMGTIFND